MTSPNTNILAGMRCPHCRSPEPFFISVKTTCLFYDEGSEEAASLEWDQSSPCTCVDCAYQGTVADFKTPADTSLPPSE